VCYLDCWATRFSRPPPLAWLGADAGDRAPGSCGRACTGYPAPASLQCQHRAELRIGPLVPDPFINNCNYDAAGEVLQWIYGTLRRRKTGRLQGSLIEFDQNEFLPNPASHGLANTGWLFLPTDGLAASTSCFTAASSIKLTFISPQAPPSAPTCYNGKTIVRF